MNVSDIQKLADLSRLAISDTEAMSLLKDMTGILEYIKQIENASVEITSESLILSNITREDTEDAVDEDVKNMLIKNMPSTDGRFLKVKKIL